MGWAKSVADTDRHGSRNTTELVHDPGARHRGSSGLESLSGGGIRGPGPMGRGACNLISVERNGNGVQAASFGYHMGTVKKQRPSRFQLSL